MKFRKIMWVAFGVAILIALVFMDRYFRASRMCRRVVFEIENMEEDMYVDTESLEHYIGVDSITQHLTVDNIKLNVIENKLLSTTYINNANAWIGSDNVLNLKMTLRQPLARVVPFRNTNSYYFDEFGYVIRASQAFGSRTVLIMGNLSLPVTDTLNDSTLLDMVPMLKYIQANPFWKAQIAEIYLQEKNELLLSPTVGNMKIKFGTAVDFQKKFERLETFYKEVLSNVGWNYYEFVNLKYENQIIAEKKNKRTTN